jgi:hypothetical protein
VGPTELKRLIDDEDRKRNQGDWKRPQPFSQQARCEEDLQDAVSNKVCAREMLGLRRKTFRGVTQSRDQPIVWFLSKLVLGENDDKPMQGRAADQSFQSAATRP